MREKQPKLKVDQLFGPDLIPPAKRFPIGFVCVALLIAIGVVGGFYWASPWWLQRELQVRLMEAEDKDQATAATEGLLQIGDDGLVTVVGALGHPNPEVARSVQRILRSKLSVMKTEELVSDPWVRRLATELKEQAGAWGPQARALGCELAADILSAYQTANDSVDGDGLRWVPTRLDCWAVLETHRSELDASLNQERENRFVANSGTLDTNDGDIGPGGLSESDDDRQLGSRGSGLVATEGTSRTIDDAMGDSFVSNEAGNSSQRSLSDSSEEAMEGDVSGEFNGEDSSSSIQVLTAGPDGRTSSENGTQESLLESDSTDPASVQFGKPKIVEAHDAPMAHISVRSARGKGDLRRSPALVQVTPRTLTAGGSSDNESRQAQDGIRNLGPIEEDLSNYEASWSGKVQTIDARYPESSIDLSVKETLAVIEYLQSDDPAVQGAAILELERRKLTSQEINLAIELLRGDTKRKVELIIGLATSGIENPRPWYVWMAQDQDREVRRVAIHALGGMRDPDVVGILRELLLRESDPEVEQTLRKILSEAGR
ncbi:MAG: hypothetical protein RLY14_2862 [Planctomycetota bacterium]|jgi:hypothetical protein